MKQRGNWYTIVLVIILAISLILLVVENLGSITGDVPLTGYAVQGHTTSNVSISKYLAIEMSTNLTAGIDFGTVENLPVTNQNGTGNYNGTNMTEYNITVHEDSNTAVNFCLMAGGPLNSGTDIIGLGNETYAVNLTTNTLTVPVWDTDVEMTTGWIHAINDTPEGNTTQWRFYLDIPAAQASGSYGNLVYFRGVQNASTTCGS